MEENFSIRDYPLSASDKLLALVRRTFKNYPEFRHDSFKYAAQFAPYLPFISGRVDLSSELKTTIDFSDGSSSLHLSCPIFLAAGANKTAYRIADYANVGFGGIVVGTATRAARAGNLHRPRIGFIEKEKAIHNSMGLNNDGVEAISSRAFSQIPSAHQKGLCVGISIAETPGIDDEDKKISDVLETFSLAYGKSDYLEVNVSCPNTGENRVDSSFEFFERLISEMMNRRNFLGEKKAVFVKLSPDFSENALKQLLDILVKNGVHGVVLGNTFPTSKMSALGLKTSYDSLCALRDDGDKGGLSGRPLFENTKKMAAFVCKNYPELRVFACGGIDQGEKIFELLSLGVSAVQCYSVVAFRWLAAHRMREELLGKIRSAGFDSLSDFLDKKNLSKKG